MQKSMIGITVLLIASISCSPSNGGNTTTQGSGNTNHAYPQGPMTGTVDVIYLHHSTGGIIWDCGVATGVSAYNASNATDYNITEIAYPHDPWSWENYPYDYWKIWVDQGTNDYYLQNETITYFSQHYDVVVFKHCYPVAEIQADETPDIHSQSKTLTNYVLQYEAIKELLHGYTNMRFIVWTGPSQLEVNLSSESATRMSNFVSWVKNEWDEPGDNIFLWDFYPEDLTTDVGLTTATTSFCGIFTPWKRKARSI